MTAIAEIRKGLEALDRSHRSRVWRDEQEFSENSDGQILDRLLMLAGEIELEAEKQLQANSGNAKKPRSALTRETVEQAADDYADEWAGKPIGQRPDEPCDGFWIKELINHIHRITKQRPKNRTVWSRIELPSVFRLPT